MNDGLNPNPASSKGKAAWWLAGIVIVGALLIAIYYGNEEKDLLRSDVAPHPLTPGISSPTVSPETVLAPSTHIESAIMEEPPTIAVPEKLKGAPVSLISPTTSEIDDSIGIPSPPDTQENFVLGTPPDTQENFVLGTPPDTDSTQTLGEAVEEVEGGPIGRTPNFGEQPPM